MDCAKDSPTIYQNNGPLLTPDPHYIPGYTGYLPQEKFRSGHTYGFTSHQILLDASVSMSNRSVLNNVHPEHCSDEFIRPVILLDPVLSAEVGLVKPGEIILGRRHYQPILTSGYTTYVPHYQTVLGHPYSPASNRDLATVEQEQWWWDPVVTNSFDSLDDWRSFRYNHKPWSTNETFLAENQDLHKFTAVIPTPPFTGFGHAGGQNVVDSI